jgi:basic membrane lipoprotein Med (substrate-binding protein (PBP1-ABC) superfamily)
MKLRTLTRRLSLSALLLGVLHLAGCGSNNATNSTTSDGNTAHGNTAGGTASPQSDMKVALLTPGDINDQGWNQLANDGLKEVQKETGAQTKHQWTQTAADHSQPCATSPIRNLMSSFVTALNMASALRRLRPSIPTPSLSSSQAM